ncbi:hypothetical protein DACRYDRAFT_112381 [Dacryopinax primogenitus]|uniref:Uncharacterized protein n=1 Tax=Dacryopinax primogenitus (strain DJM 731) TaxID=1858805 RepID=M5FP30_DACPD|nr:uncharacterized protein DACRYDRAFT_112381 [Dacryopinax primogenitus]EJT96758.1 hypothetical protein DACRYDRAFT_112381 [Dacryopinax primogenitus]
MPVTKGSRMPSSAASRPQKKAGILGLPSLKFASTKLDSAAQVSLALTLLHLRRTGLFGFVPTVGSFSEPFDTPEPQNWWDAKKGGHEAFLTSLGKASFPALESVTLFNLSL